MFKLDSKEKIEALNFATMLNVLKCSEKKLEEQFDRFALDNDISKMIDDEMVYAYELFFGIKKEIILQEFELAKDAFEQLDENDEIIKRGSHDYPKNLEETQEAPRFLYLRGKKALLYETRNVAIVGSRKASAQAIDNTIRLTKELGRNGITIVSGLAKGIDVNAHRTALENGYNTIAVIGTSLNRYYPVENKAVQIDIEKRGLIVSQFSPAAHTNRWCFPMRNGVMSGLSMATVIMEAGETSGALKQADYAIKQHRLVLIPEKALKDKRITWPQKYVVKGAKVVVKPIDILHELKKYNIYNANDTSVEQLSIFNCFLEDDNEYSLDVSDMLVEK